MRKEKNNYKKNIIDYLGEQWYYYLNENEIKQINITIHDNFNILTKFLEKIRLDKEIKESKNL